MANASGCDDGEIAYDNSSKMVLKRPHQWFVDGAEPELFPSKKQAVEGPSHHSFLGLLSSDNSHWGNGSRIHSAMGLFTECLLEPETARTINFDDNSTPSVVPCNTNMDRRIIEDSCGSNSSFGLSVSHTLEDPRSGLNCGGIRKVKVSQVKDSENFMSASVELAYNREDNSTMSTTHAYGKADENCISMGLSYNSGNGTIVSMDDAYNSADNNYMSMGHNKEEDCTMLMGHPYKEPNIGISMGQSFRKDGDSIVKIGQTFNQDDDNNRSFGTSLQDSDITISMGQSFSKGDDSVLSMAQTFIRDDNNNTSINNSYSKLDQSDKVRNDIELMGQLFGKGESNIISFGGQDDDDISSSGRLMCSSDLFMGNFSSQRQLLSEKCLVESNVDAVAIVTKMTCSGSVSGSKSKEDKKGSKKVPPNNFPSNVRSLLSTGMLDGVPVKYNAWSREKELHGIIKGSGYLCGCQLCNFSKAINAYEFERHAGCKTKHPNNHIYFENGKTIYGIVQELRNTPQDLLFEVIQTITGSPINQKAFRLWRESFLAATCELQRIYGKDEGKQFS